MSFLKNIGHLKQAVSKLTQLEAAGKSVALCPQALFHSYTIEPSHPIPKREPKWATAEEAVSIVKSGT